MSRRVFAYAKLFLKIFFSRRRHGGAEEFKFRPRFAGRGWHKIEVAAHDGGFRATIMLRRGTSDLAVFRQVFVNNDYNLRRIARWNEIREIYDGLAKDGTPLILDLGANIGLASLYFAKNWPDARILAVEPSHDNYHLMCRNLAEHKNVRPINAAVAGEDCTVKIANPDACAWAYRTERAVGESDDPVPAKSVNSLLRMAESADRNLHPFIAKIDIEGFEQDLFSKNTEWIKLFPVIIIELHDWMLPGKGNSNNFLRAISQHARDFLFFGENVISIANDGAVHTAKDSSSSTGSP